MNILHSEKYTGQRSAQGPSRETPLFGEPIQVDQQDTTLNLTEHNGSSPMGQREYLEKSLMRHHEKDTRGFERSIFTILGREVMFRNRDEFPRITDRDISIVDKELAPPVYFTKKLAETGSGDYEQYLSESVQDSRDALLVVTNTPEGILMAASQLSGDAELEDIASGIAKGIYSDKVMAVLDGILATTQLDDEGVSEYMDVDGYAVVLAALSGDSTAQKIMGRRIDLLYDELSRIRKAHLDSVQSPQADIESQYPPLEAHEMVLVHSTSHAVEKDDEGNVVLYPAFFKRPDKHPRSTVHFTVNGQVTSHIFGAWGDDNRLIVGNFAAILGANGSPANFNTADTYFSLNPGDKVVIPGALVVESRENGPLLEQSDDGVTYVQKSTYTAQEVAQIAQLAGEYKVSMGVAGSEAQILREVALRIAEERLGCRKFETISEHGANSPVKPYLDFAQREGFHQGVHMYNAEGRLEALVAGGLSASGQSAEYADYSKQPVRELHYSLVEETRATSIEALRTVVAAGYLPTRSAKLDPSREKAFSFDGFI